MVSSEELRAAREQQRLTLGQFADLTGRDKGHLSRVERGERAITPALVRDYERVLNTSFAPSIVAMPDGPVRAVGVPDRTLSTGEAVSALIDWSAETDRDTPGQAAAVSDLAEAVAEWATRTSGTVNRRELLTRLSTVFAVAAASPMLTQRVLDLASSASTDTGARHPAGVALIADNLMRCRQQADVLGPSASLPAVAAQQQILSEFLSASGADNSTLAVFAEANQLMGWLLFNLGDYRSAQHYYEEARAAAHEAHDMELVTYVLCAMSHLATWQGRPRVGIDHAVAAAQWASRTSSAPARGYAADVMVRAFVADRDASSARRALDQEHTALASISADQPPTRWWYFYDESFALGTETEYALGFGFTEQADRAAKKTLRLADPSNVHNYAFSLLLQSEVLIQAGEIAGAAQLIGDVAGFGPSSPRAQQRISGLRKSLAPWADHSSVRELDERLRTTAP
ncbi:helix-turn-helix domain-containing protein [Cryptosporangium phraense]|uniref:helix-turn-helix domain-containing protein n=1 Tax=Cryptosporangium phraense TaxID=2593070 RepID=UPI001478E53A|nr:helix-turn-helix transcriptional regulator [Cryptosporangium phraense]